MPDDEIVEFGRFPFVPAADNLKPRPDRRAVAAVMPDESTVHVAELSAEGLDYGPSFPQIFPKSVEYSSSGRLAYIASEGDAGQFLILDESKSSDVWDAISDELGWSEDSRSYSFAGLRGKSYFVIRQDQQWEMTGTPLPRRFVQNQDGTQIAWVIQSRNQQLFVNGQLHWEAPEIIGNPLWSPDGKQIAFPYGDDKGVRIRVDRHEYGPYPSLFKGGIVWSPDGRRCGWVIQKGGKSTVVIDGEEVRLPFSVIHGGTFAFSPDENHWSLSAHAGFLRMKGCVVVDGKGGPLYLGLGTTPPIWNAQGTALSYFALSGLRKAFIVCDGREGQKCNAFIDGSLTWHPDGDVVGCIAQQNGAPCYIIEGRDGPSWSLRPKTGLILCGDRVAFDEGSCIHDLGFREDGSFFGWTATFR